MFSRSSWFWFIPPFSFNQARTSQRPPLGQHYCLNYLFILGPHKVQLIGRLPPFLRFIVFFDHYSKLSPRYNQNTFFHVPKVEATVGSPPWSLVCSRSSLARELPKRIRACRTVLFLTIDSSSLSHDLSDRNNVVSLLWHQVVVSPNRW